MLMNRLPRYEILSEQALEAIDRTWRRLVSEIGVDFQDDTACRIFAGRRPTRRSGTASFSIPNMCSNKRARRLRASRCSARNAERNLTIGGDNMVVASFGGPPFVRRGEDRVRALPSVLVGLRAPMPGLPRDRHGRAGSRTERNACRDSAPLTSSRC